jgi:Flp pilus assembly pilin Flp
MGYELMGRAHAAWTAGREQSGQGTVEYVGLILLIAVVMAAAVSATKGGDIGAIIMAKLKSALDGVGAAK